MKRILSLGAGVQSSALLLMSCRGVLPKLDCAIFSDTQWEPKEVYTHLQWLIGESEAHGIPVHIVTAGDIRQDAIDFRTIGSSKNKKRFASLPNFIKNKDGSQGIIRRQCTTEYKIEPVEKFIRREILGLKPRQRAPKEVVVEQWFGISADEVQRMSTSRVPWKVHRYPLIKDLAVKKPGLLFPSGYTRQDCLAWLAKHYPGRHIPRSACLGCPFHSDDEWLAIKSRPDEWADVVDFDKKMRSSNEYYTKRGKLDGEIYLHRSLLPLDMVDLVPGQHKDDGMVNECLGMCGV